VANFAFQVTGAFQGNGQFAFQGSTVVVTVQHGTFNLRPRKRRKKREFDYFPEKEETILEVIKEPELEHIEALAIALAEKGIPFRDIGLETEDEEEDALLSALTVRIIQ